MGVRNWLKKVVRAANNGMHGRQTDPPRGKHMYSQLRKFGLVAVLGSLVLPAAIRAEIVTKPGQLVVIDKGEFFSDKGIDRAKEEFARLNSKTGRQAMVETWKELPDTEKARFEK